MQMSFEAGTNVTILFSGWTTDGVGELIGSAVSREAWGRCYDHNFMRFLPIFGKKIGVFLKNQSMIQFLHNLALFLAKTANFFGKKFAKKI
jgi:hypothetical protein